MSDSLSHDSIALGDVLSKRGVGPVRSADVSDPSDSVCVDRLVVLAEGRLYDPVTDSVAVVFAPCWGGSWSTEAADTPERLARLFDPQLALAVIAGETRAANRRAEEIEMAFRTVFPDQVAGFVGEPISIEFTRDFKVAWVKRGDRFRVAEYDGWEAVVLFSKMRWDTA